MRYIIISILLLVLGQAGGGITITPNIPFISHYTGPGDQLSGASAWYGLRAYSKAFASTNGAAINVRRASDSTTKDIKVLITGNLDIATANTFAGTDATCTGTASASTTLALTGCSSTPTAGDTLTSTGGTGSFTQPAYIVSCGAFAGGAGNCTLNVAQTVTGVTVTAQVGLFITEAYDQTGNGFHLTQATHATQPQLLPSCLNGLPCMFFNGSNKLTAASCSLNGLPFFLNMVGERTGNTSAFNQAISACGGGGGNTTQLTYNNSPNQVETFAGGAGALAATASDNAAHILQVFTPYFGNTSIYVDNTKTTGAAGNTAFVTNSASALGDASAGSSLPLTGYIMEAGIWQLTVTANQVTNVCVDNNNYWFAGAKSCSAVAPTAYTTVTEPCDLVTCAEAWSVTRAMKSSYTGPLFQLYNGTSTLDIGQNTTTRAADMTTWSAFCSGVQANCSVSRIYSQIQVGKNDLVPQVFTAASCNSTIFSCASTFSIDVPTGLPVVKTSGTTGNEYSINNTGASCCSGAVATNETAATNISGGTADHTLMVVANDGAVTSVIPCCGFFGLSHQWQAAQNVGSDFMAMFSFNHAFTNVPSCSPTGAVYCLNVDAENGISGAHPSDWGLIGATAIDLVEFIDTSASGSGQVDIYYNGHTLIQHSPPNTAINLYSGPYVHFGGGGDLTQPAPAIWREAFITNNVLSSTNRSNVFSNTMTFYSGLTFP